MGIRPKPYEPLRDYISRFTKEALQVHDLLPGVELHLLKDGLLTETLFHTSPSPRWTNSWRRLKHISTTKRRYRLYARFEMYQSKYCHFHKSRGHNTKECIQLKDTVEGLIRKGKLGVVTITIIFFNYDFKLNFTIKIYSTWFLEIQFVSFEIWFFLMIII